MKNIFSSIVVIITLFLSIGIWQSKGKEITGNKPKSLKYAGTYRYGSYADSSQTGGGGQIIIYAESDDTVLFYIDLSVGAPSYNMGMLYDRFPVKSDKCVYYKKCDFCISPCKWSITFNDSSLIIETIDHGYDCGFGGNVIPDNIYKKISSQQPDYFEDPHGRKVYFSKTKPENYSF